MDPRLFKLVRDYQRAVARAVALLNAAGVPRPASNNAWALAQIPPEGDLAEGCHYHKHGYGCAVRAPSWHVDFDFGDTGQIDGFDLWRLQDFADARLAEYGFKSEEELEEAFGAAVAAGDLQYSGYILYYVAGRGACP